MTAAPAPPPAAGNADDATGRRTPLVLRNRAFAAVWLGQVLTQAAVRMFQVGVSWWIVAYAVHDARGLASGLFMAACTLPAVALAPVVAGAVARFAHRSVLRTAALLAGAASGSLALWAHGGALPLTAVYAAALALATCQAFFDPCLTTSVPELVDDADIEAATGFELSTQSLAGLGGALLGALTVDRAGVAGLAAGCAAAYLGAALFVASARFRTAAPQPSAATEGPAGDPATVPRRRGLLHILRELPYVRRILVCFTAANLFTTAVFVVIPSTPARSSPAAAPPWPCWRPPSAPARSSAPSPAPGFRGGPPSRAPTASSSWHSPWRCPGWWPTGWSSRAAWSWRAGARGPSASASSHSSSAWCRRRTSPVSSP
ncbi:MFS transporter [Streptomyces cirratus]|uniref:MFS transporter n=1 Tax=Streptomyces cirratus TaxID=68187 RepID=UPI0036198398